MAGGFQGGSYSAGPPVRKSGGGGCLVWGLVGCGALVLLAAVGLFFALRSGPFQKLLTGQQAAQTCAGNMVTLGNAMQKYLTDHEGKYPAKLEALTPKYLPDNTELTCGMDSNGQAAKIEYTPPKADAPDDTPVATLRTSENEISIASIRTYLRLLKDGRVVQDQVTRTDLSALRRNTPTSTP